MLLLLLVHMVSVSVSCLHQPPHTPSPGTSPPPPAGHLNLGGRGTSARLHIFLISFVFN